MDRRAFNAAADYAQRAKEKLASLSDVMLGHQFVRIWEEYLRDLTASFNKLAAGAKAGKSAPWAGRIRHDRWNDPLLIYLRNARDAIDHGIDPAAVIRAEHRAVAPGEFSPIAGIIAKRKDGTEIFLPAATNVEIIDERAELIMVVNNKKSFDPPDTHLGKPIPDKLATTAGSLALAYLERKLEEARELIVP